MYFSWKENILVYPTGIVSVLIYVYITWQYGLYADAGVNFYYFLMSVYGWYHWTHTNDSSEQIPITRNSKSDNLLSLVIFVTAYVLLVFIFASLGSVIGTLLGASEIISNLFSRQNDVFWNFGINTLQKWVI